MLNKIIFLTYEIDNFLHDWFYYSIYSLGCILYELLTLNEYYIDKKDEKETHINSDIYNPKWQELIDLLLQEDYNARPDIEECINRIQLIKNEIQQWINLIKINNIKK